MAELSIPDLAQQFIVALHEFELGGADSADALIALFSTDARLTNSALKLSNVERQGIAGVREFWIKYRASFGELRSEFFQVTTNDCAAGLFWTSKGTDSNGQPVEYDGVSLLVFDEEGKIALFRGYYDTRQLSQTVGG